MRREEGYSIGAQISAVDPGQCQITDAWVEFGGARVTQVPPGQAFIIKCTYVAQDRAITPFNRTLLSITVKDSTGQIKNYEDILLEYGGIGSSGTVTLSKKGQNIMLSQNITLNFKMWMNDDSNIAIPYPPERFW